MHSSGNGENPEVESWKLDQATVSVAGFLGQTCRKVREGGFILKREVHFSASMWEIDM